MAQRGAKNPAYPYAPSMSGGIGILRLLSPITPARGSGSVGGFFRFFTSGSLIEEYDSRRGEGFLVCTYSPTDYLEAVMVSAATSHYFRGTPPGEDEEIEQLAQAIGDFDLAVKAGYSADPALHVGGEARLRIFTRVNDLGPLAESISGGARFLFQFDFSEVEFKLAREVPLRLIANLGYFFDRSHTLVAQNDLVALNYALGIGTGSYLWWGIGLEFPQRLITPFIEYSQELILEERTVRFRKFNETPTRVTPGIRVTPLPGLGIIIGVDVSAGMNEETSYVYREGADEASVTARPSPMWAVILGMTYQFQEKGSVGPGTITGRVIHSESKMPIESARIAFPGTPMSSVLTDPEGEYRAYLQKGETQVSARKEGFFDQTKIAPVTPGEEIRVDFELGPVSRAGIISATVRDPEGNPLPAVITIRRMGEADRSTAPQPPVKKPVPPPAPVSPIPEEKEEEIPPLGIAPEKLPMLGEIPAAPRGPEIGEIEEEEVPPLDLPVLAAVPGDEEEEVPLLGIEPEDIPSLDEITTGELEGPAIGEIEDEEVPPLGLPVVSAGPLVSAPTATKPVPRQAPRVPEPEKLPPSTAPKPVLKPASPASKPASLASQPSPRVSVPVVVPIVVPPLAVPPVAAPVPAPAAAPPAPKPEPQPTPRAPEPVKVSPAPQAPLVGVSSIQKPAAQAPVEAPPPAPMEEEIPLLEELPVTEEAPIVVAAPPVPQAPPARSPAVQAPAMPKAVPKPASPASSSPRPSPRVSVPVVVPVAVPPLAAPSVAAPVPAPAAAPPAPKPEPQPTPRAPEPARVSPAPEPLRPVEAPPPAVVEDEIPLLEELPIEEEVPVVVAAPPVPQAPPARSPAVQAPAEAPPPAPMEEEIPLLEELPVTEEAPIVVAAPPVQQVPPAKAPVGQAPPAPKAVPKPASPASKPAPLASQPSPRVSVPVVVPIVVPPLTVPPVAAPAPVPAPAAAPPVPKPVPRAPEPARVSPAPQAPPVGVSSVQKPAAQAPVEAPPPPAPMEEEIPLLEELPVTEEAPIVVAAPPVQQVPPAKAPVGQAPPAPKAVPKPASPASKPAPLASQPSPRVSVPVVVPIVVPPLAVPPVAAPVPAPAAAPPVPKLEPQPAPAPGVPEPVKVSPVPEPLRPVEAPPSAPIEEEIPLLEELPVIEEALVAVAAPPASEPEIFIPVEVSSAPVPPEAPVLAEPPAQEELLIVAEAPPVPDFEPAMEFPPPKGVTDLAWISGDWIKVARMVTFPIDQITPTEDSLAIIDAVARILKENLRLRIRVEGHADDNGPARYNQELSDYRAIEVKNYLVSRGISQRRIEIFGYGESRPIGEPETLAGRSENRRVDFRIVER